MKISDILKKLKIIRAESFTSKIYLTHIFSIVVISLSFTAFHIHYEKKSRTRVLINKGELLAAQLAENARIGAFAEDRELLADTLHSVFRQRDVLKALIYGENGKLLIERWKPDAESRRELRTGEAGNAQNIIDLIRKSGKPLCLPGENTIDFWAPVQHETDFYPQEALLLTDNPQQNNKRTIGFVCLVMGKKQLHEAFQILIFNSIMITAVFLVMALAITYLVTRSITKPLKGLKKSVNDLGSGVLVKKIPVETNDEVGELAGAFNTMAESLKMREKEKDELATQLLQAQKMEAMGTLAGGVAHDFNNILTGIIGYGNLLRDELCEDGLHASYASEILNAANKASDLTQRLLAFSKKQAINTKVINLNYSILNLNKLLLRLISENIDFRIDLTEEDLYILADKGQMEQILVNLVTNASDAMPEGGVLTISTRSVAADNGILRTFRPGKNGKFACLTITDTGKGIDKEIKGRIFDPFFTTKEVGKGTGLGLSIVYGIVNQSGGLIEVESEPDKQTSFVIYLPLTEPLDEEEDTEQPVLPKGNNETVLFAEDDFAVRMLGKRLLTKHGYRVIEAGDGEDAVVKFLENKDSVHILLLDVIMPKKNGKQVFEEIRKIRPDIKALFTSGYTYDVIGEQNIEDEGMAFISKPLQPYELLRKLRAVITNEYVPRPGTTEQSGFTGKQSV
ncbi:MAG TPA: ATP-binding protein [Geobacteraceae bacterium]|nr:ATP-binding protein [Geobacteraceae bacterium]